MNTVILMGRLTRDPEVRYSQGENAMAIARYSLAVDRPKTRNNQEPGADFINCVAFGKSGEHAEKYFRQGMRVLISGRIQTGSYTNRDGQKVYTTVVTAAMETERTTAITAVATMELTVTSPRTMAEATVTAVMATVTMAAS